MTKNANRYFIAVDGGGSKTEFCACEIASGRTWNFRYGSSNYKIIRDNEEKEIILTGIGNIFEVLNIDDRQVDGLVMGMSGVDSPSDYEHYKAVAAATGIATEKTHVCNDSELAFYSVGVPPGICIIAGTGSVVTGIGANGQQVRAGGWGSPISDEGSGGWMGIRVLRDVLRYCDGYGKYQDVFEAIRIYFKAPSFEEMPNVLTQANMAQIASTARVVMDEADKGDSYSLGIVDRAARLVSEIAYAVYRRLEFHNESAVDIVMAGSLYKSFAFKSMLTQYLVESLSKDNLRFCEETASPVSGGIKLAHHLFG